MSNQKEWSFFLVDEKTGVDQQQIFINNNPTIKYAELVLQPKTLVYGLYRIVFTLQMTNSDATLVRQVDTFLQIVASGLVLSTLRTSQPMFGGLIEVSRGQMQKIEFNPYLNTYDLDGVAVITSLMFKYSCQIVDSNSEKGYPRSGATNQTISLDEFKQNNGLRSLETCFNSTGFFFIYRLDNILVL